MTTSELKYQVEVHGHAPYFFTRDTMRFFGDTMRNYGVRSAGTLLDCYGEVECWELYRKHPVKNGLSSSVYFNKQTFRQIHPF